MSKYAKERNEAFRAVLYDDDMSKLKMLASKYWESYPSSERVAKAAVYKAIGEINSFAPKEKELASMKAIMLGFSPKVRW